METYDKEFWDSFEAIFDLFFRLVAPALVFSVIVALAVFFLTFLSRPKPALWELPTHWMFVFFGVSVGTLTGIPTQSPMGDILPAVITVVMGILAYLSTKEINVRFRSLIPVYIMQFLIGTISGFFYGDWIKG